MDNDVDAAKTITNCVGYDRAAFRRGNIRRHEQIGLSKFGRRFSSSREDLHSHFTQTRHHRFANSLSATGDEGAAAIQFEIVAHDRISSDVILSPSSVKTNS